MTLSPTGAAAGLALGGALVALLSWVGARRPLRTLDRIGPFVGLPGVASAARLEPTVTVRTLVGRWGAGASRADGASLATRLARAGLDTTVVQYQWERLTWAAIAAAAGFLLGMALAPSGPSPLAAGLLGITGSVAGWSACDARLRHRVRQRQRVLEAQLPMLADLVALAVSSGASPVAALEAASGAMGGPMAQETGRALELIRGGASVDAGLRSLAAHTGVPSMLRFVEALLIAIELGTPLAEVARAQAADIRADERRRLMETAGRKDVAMLVPIVFLVLPSVVLIALFPGVQSLRLVVP